MNPVLESVVTICVILIATEVIGRFCPKNAMLQFVRALVAVVLLVSAAASLFSADLDLSLSQNRAESAQEELSGYLEEQYGKAASEEAKQSLEGLFAVAGLKAEKIEIFTDINEESSIVLTKVSAVFAYESDAQRAKALLQNTLGDEIEIEVKTDGV